MRSYTFFNCIGCSIYFQAHGGFGLIPFLLSSVRLLQKISRLAKLPTGGAQRGACAKNFRFFRITNWKKRSTVMAGNNYVFNKITSHGNNFWESILLDDVIRRLLMITLYSKMILYNCLVASCVETLKVKRVAVWNFHKFFWCQFGWSSQFDGKYPHEKSHSCAALHQELGRCRKCNKQVAVPEHLGHK